MMKNYKKLKLWQCKVRVQKANMLLAHISYLTERKCFHDSWFELDHKRNVSFFDFVTNTRTELPIGGERCVLVDALLEFISDDLQFDPELFGCFHLDGVNIDSEKRDDIAASCLEFSRGSGMISYIHYPDIVDSL